MPSPKLPSRYPNAFRSLFERAQAGESITVPSSNPTSLRGKLYAYSRALRADNQSELADSLQIKLIPGAVIIEHRSHSQEAKEIISALSQLESPPAEESPDSFFERIAK